MKTLLKTKLIKRAMLYFIIFICSSFFTFSQTPIFYGMTEYGGMYNDNGAIISFDPNTKVESVLWNFGAHINDGAEPYRNLIYLMSNNLFYGMTQYGGTDSGTVFSFYPNSKTDSVLRNLGTGTDGKVPLGNLVLNPFADSLYYEMTSLGGDYNKGAIISFNINNNSESVVWSFGKGTDGALPRGDLVFYPYDGVFYGMTNSGGVNNGGAIISFDPVHNTDSLCYSFGNKHNDGSLIYGNLIWDPITKLFYGMTLRGGSERNGTLISFNPVNDSEAVVWNFGNGKDGSRPYGSPVYNPFDSLLYAMTSIGGVNNMGAIISFNPATGIDSLRWSFGSKFDGNTPYGDLVYDLNNSLFYGMTSGGGYDSVGTIFAFNPKNDTEAVEYYFNKVAGSDGQSPHGNLILVSLPVSTSELTGKSEQITIEPNPNNGKFNLVIGRQSSVVSENCVEIYNVLGQQVYTQFSGFNSPLSINMYSQPNGVYFYKVVKNGGELLGEGKFIIEK